MTMRPMTRALTLTGILATVLWAGFPADLAAQDSDTEAVMVAAGQWAASQLPSGELGLDPHRTGRSTSQDVARRVASNLGARLMTLEEARPCTDPTDPSTCQLQIAALLAIGAPAVDGDGARVRVYAWYRQDSRHNPVAQESWDLTLRRTSGGWQVNL
ncbi:MAG TPA: hypothetical protein VK966_00090 [Longimicrobiales bacterium]|nr:hypothetical protein [Longimicrobiales bacterium]